MELKLAFRQRQTEKSIADEPGRFSEVECVALRFSLFLILRNCQEILNQGNADQSMTDPSLSQLLKTNGVPKVMSIITQLSTFDLIADAQPGKGADFK
jgi:hypothetical protein